MFKFKARPQVPLGAAPLLQARSESAQRMRDTDRRHLLQYAANLTAHRSLPGAVMANLTPLQEWVDQATGDRDRRARMDALRHADDNRQWSNGRLIVVTPDDDPDRLIDDAQSYYAYLSGQPQLPTTA